MCIGFQYTEVNILSSWGDTRTSIKLPALHSLPQYIVNCILGHCLLIYAWKELSSSLPCQMSNTCHLRVGHRAWIGVGLV